MDLENVPDLLMWTLVALVLIDILRRLSFGPLFSTIKRSLERPISPTVTDLTVKIGGKRRYSCFNLIPSGIDCIESLFDMPEISTTKSNSVPTTVSYTNLSARNSAHLQSTYPSVSSLNLILDQIKPQNSTPALDLLAHFGKNLKSLKLIINFAETLSNKPKIHDKIAEIITIINSMDSLAHLTFEIGNAYPKGMNLEILRKLQEFNFSSRIGSNMLIQDALLRFASKSLKIGLANEQDTGSFSMDRENRGLFDQIVDLRFSPSFMVDQKLDFLCSNFRGLRFLDICIENLFLVRFLGMLAQLRSLENLKVQITSKPVTRLSVSDWFALDRIPQLTNLKALTLIANVQSHSDLTSVHLGHIFPCLELIQLDYDYFICPACECDHYKDDVKSQDCARKMLTPWIEQCRGLKKAVALAWSSVRLEILD